MFAFKSDSRKLKTYFYWLKQIIVICCSSNLMSTCSILLLVQNMFSLDKFHSYVIGAMLILHWFASNFYWRSSFFTGAIPMCSFNYNLHFIDYRLLVKCLVSLLQFFFCWMSFHLHCYNSYVQLLSWMEQGRSEKPFKNTNSMNNSRFQSNWFGVVHMSSGW